MPVDGRKAFSYAVVRVVPHVERGEFFNAGVVLFSRQHDFLAARVELNEQRLSALSPETAPASVRSHLDALVRVADGDADAGPIAEMPQSERFGWLVAPSSTIIQTSPVHTGLCDDPRRALDELFTDMVG
jgi:hypothetical protein